MNSLLAFAGAALCLAGMAVILFAPRSLPA